MSRVAVTGGTGFIGSNLVRRLLVDGQEVHLLNRPGYADWRIADIAEAVHIHQLDLADVDAVVSLMRRLRPKVIFHLAAHGNYSWQTDLRTMIGTNYATAISLIEACDAADVETLVNVGSSSEYGLKNHPAREDDAIEPNSDYAATKAAATLMFQSRARRSGRKMPTLRLYSVYGHWEEPDRLLPRLISRGLDGGWPSLVNPTVARDLIFVDDVVDALSAAAAARLDDPGTIINIASGQQKTLAEIVATVAEVLNITVAPAWGTMLERGWDTRTWTGRPDRAVAVLKWRAITGLAHGVRQFAAWIADDPERRQRYRLQRNDQAPPKRDHQA